MDDIGAHLDTGVNSRHNSADILFSAPDDESGPRHSGGRSFFTKPCFREHTHTVVTHRYQHSEGYPMQLRPTGNQEGTLRV